MTKIDIFGEISDLPGDCCFSPRDLKEILDGLPSDEALDVEITSEGGSVFAGLQIANMLSQRTAPVTTHAVGYCASIATVILMAGSKILVDSNAFCLIHLPWSVVQGNVNELQREIDALTKCKDAMMSYYGKKSKVPAEQILDLMENETWLVGTEFAEVFDVEVFKCDEPVRIAAKAELKKFKNLPKELISSMEQIKNKAEGLPEEEKKPEETAEELEETTEETTEKPVEEQVEQPVEEEVEKPAEEEAAEETEEKDEDEDEESVPRAEVEKRVSGMQAKMQRQVNDFKAQLELKEKELTKAQARITSLSDELDKIKAELSETASALESKRTALATLNAGVLSPAETLPSMQDGLARCKTPAEKVAFIKSGKYVKN